MRKPQSRWIVAEWDRATQRRPGRIEAIQWEAFPSHTGKKGFHPRFINPSCLYSSKPAGKIRYLPCRHPSARRGPSTIFAHRRFIGARTQGQRHLRRIYSPVPVSEILTNRGRYPISPRADTAHHDGATTIYYSHWLIVERLCTLLSKGHTGRR